MVAGAVPAILGCLEQPLHFRRIQVVLGPLVGVGCATLYVSPLVTFICPSETSMFSGESIAHSLRNTLLVKSATW